MADCAAAVCAASRMTVAITGDKRFIVLEFGKVISGPNVAQRTSDIQGEMKMSVPIIVGLLLLIVVAIIGTSLTRRNAESTAGTQTTVIVIVAVVIVGIVVYFILGGYVNQARTATAARIAAD